MTARERYELVSGLLPALEDLGAGGEAIEALRSLLDEEWRRLPEAERVAMAREAAGG